MAYATVQDMIARFGETEMVRLSAGDGPIPETVIPAALELALTDATALVESYLRKRYTVPLTAPTADIVRATCVLARHGLATGGDREASTQVKEDRRETLAWLGKISEGVVTLEGVAPVAGGAGAQVFDRPRVFSPESLRDW